MSSMHINEQMFAAVADGEIPARVLVEIIFKHFLELCPHCRREFETWKKNRSRSRTERSEYAEVFALFEERLAGMTQEVATEEEAIKAWIARLGALSRQERLRTIAEQVATGPREIEALLAESEAALPANPQHSFEWAELAEAASRRAHKSDPNQDALALALMGNGTRAQGDLRGADGYFARARRLVLDLGVTDTAVCARIDSLEGSLRRDQRQLKLAEELLSRAAMLYEMLGQKVSAVRQIVKLAAIYRINGAPSDAVESLSHAIEALSEYKDSNLYLRARFNLALNLHEVGENFEALDYLNDDATLYRQSNDYALRGLRVWLHGKIMFAINDESRAERYLRVAYRAFADRPLDQVLVGLDLCLLYLGQGKLAEIRTLAGQAVVVFESQSVHAEAWTALVIFREAAERQRLTVAFLHKLARYLERAKADPSARFVEPS